MQSGLEESVRQQRLTLFGQNEIDIEEKSVLSLLVDEVRVIQILATGTELTPHLDHPSFLCVPNRHYHRLVLG